MVRLTRARLAVWIIVAICSGRVGHAQPTSDTAAPAASGAAAAQPAVPEIADEPRTIDPGTLLPAPLAARVTVDLAESSLREVAHWLEQERGLTLVVDQNALTKAEISLAEPVSERLDDLPVYLLLNRLAAVGVGWYFADDILQLTSLEAAEERQVTVPYNIAHLRDAGYELDDLANTTKATIDPVSWSDVGGEGALQFLGDVMFVRQSSRLQREVEGLLEALEQFGRQTFIYQPPAHEAIRRRLAEPVSVEFRDLPLELAASQLAQQAGIDIRLDVPNLLEEGIRERQPVTLVLSDASLETVLQALVLHLDLTWLLRDGILWITTSHAAETQAIGAVYDVRDLCRDEQESLALIDALTSQTDPNMWSDVGGPYDVTFARPGVMVVAATDRVHANVLELLETYRTALRGSRRRERDAEDPNEVVTVYYRLPAEMARDLMNLLPELVEPDSWKTPLLRPGAPGELFLASSSPELHAIDDLPKADPSVLAQYVARAVLIVRNRRAVHDEIAQVIERVQRGDFSAEDEAETMGGGFGGGLFSVDGVRQLQADSQ